MEKKKSMHILQNDTKCWMEKFGFLFLFFWNKKYINLQKNEKFLKDV